MIEIKEITTFKPVKTDRFFFDNNVWMFLFCPIGNHYKSQQTAYSNFLQEIKTVDATIYINSMVLSEFANRYLRLDFDIWKKKNGYLNALFKRDYLTSERYQRTAKSVVASMRQIIKLSKITADNFQFLHIETIFEHFMSIDFNDSFFIEYCQHDNIKLVTDDKDFSKIESANITIITHQ